MYSFRKVNDLFSGAPTSGAGGSAKGGVWEFQQPYFQRDRPDLLAMIKRKASKNSAPAGSTSSSAQRPRSSGSASPRSSHASSDELAPEPYENRRAVEHDQRRPYSAEGPTQAKRQRLGWPDDAAARPLSRDGIAPHDRDPYRQQPQLAPPPPPSFYHPPPPPPQQTHSAPPFHSVPSVYRPPEPQHRQPSVDEIAHQLAGLDHQVRHLTQVMHRSQEEHMAERQDTAVALRMLLRVVAGLDSSGERRDETESFARRSVEESTPMLSGSFSTTSSESVARPYSARSPTGGATVVLPRPGSSSGFSSTAAGPRAVPPVSWPAGKLPPLSSVEGVGEILRKTKEEDEPSKDRKEWS
ncbi:hypothetical protein MNV49_003962 [Pseudohyphozyma bogoriensis]|nr:hypothetical protein MNV49_003962 [Pseudohyphozyma bogoriensis]